MNISEECISEKGEHYGKIYIVYDAYSSFYQKLVEIPMPVETKLVFALHTYVDSQLGAIVSVNIRPTSYALSLIGCQFRISTEEYNQIRSLKMAYSTLKEYYARSSQYKTKPIEEPIKRQITNAIMELET